MELPDGIDLRLLSAAVEAAGEATLITTADIDETGRLIHSRGDHAAVIVSLAEIDPAAA